MLAEKIKNDLTDAMRARDELRVSTLRMLSSAIMYYKLERKEDRNDVSDADVQNVAAREIKKRRESVELYKKGGRDEQAAKEAKEIEILSSYVPEQMSRDEVSKIVEETIAETGASGMDDMGRVMGAVMGKLKGKADGSIVGEVVREKLG